MGSREDQLLWFHGKLARDRAEVLLREESANVEHADGTFLVRESHSSDGDYVLSVLHHDEIYHYQIRRHGEDAFFSIDEQQPIHGLDTLIEHYRGAAHGLVTQLGAFVHSGEQPPHDSRSHGRTNLLHRATREGDVTVVSELLKCGYRNLDAKNQDGQTAVHLATRCGSERILEQLLASGANVNCRDSEGNTALHFACHSSAIPLIHMLIEAKANIQARNNATGCVPLHDAARQGHLNAVKALLAHGAPHMPRTNSGELPVDFAREGAHHEVAHFLEHYRAPDSGAFKYQWYHGTLDRAEATAILRQHARRMVLQSSLHTNGNNSNGNGQPEQSADANGNDEAAAEELSMMSSGVFLVRFSAKTGDFVLTLLFENQPKNFIIQKYMKCLYIDEGPYMPTLEHLIQHYQRFSDGLPVNLRHAVPPKPKPPLPLFSTIPKSARVKHTRGVSPAIGSPTTPQLPHSNASTPGKSIPPPARRNMSIPSDALMNTVGLLSPPASPSPQKLSTSPQQTTPTTPSDREHHHRSRDILNFRSLKLGKKNIIIDGVKSLKKAKKSKKSSGDDAAAAASSPPPAMQELSMSLRNWSFSSDLKPIGSTSPNQSATAVGTDFYNVPTNNAAVHEETLPPDHPPPPPPIAASPIATATPSSSSEPQQLDNTVDYFTESDYFASRDKDAEEIYFIDAPTKTVDNAVVALPPPAAPLSPGYLPFRVVPYFPDGTEIPPPYQHPKPDASTTTASSALKLDRLASTVSLTSTASERFFRQQLSTDSTHPLAGGTAKPNYFIPAEALQQRTVLGEGEFGSVFVGTFRWSADGRTTEDVPVAIKTLHDEHCQQNRAEFLREASVMIKLSHHCIVRLIGISKGPPLMMVQELVELGSMLNFIVEHPDQIGVQFELKLWAAQIACGMDFLESHHFVHRDLAARNILLASRHQAKISDFGLSRALATDRNYYQASQGGKWPIKWYAPESFNYGTFSHASDVWSFGVTLWEMFSYGEVPYGDLKGVDVIRLVEVGERLQRTAACPERVFACMENCWNYNPKDRPTFRYLMRFFASDPDYQNMMELIPNAQIG